MARFQGAGGTPGGVGEFVTGLAMAGWGAYLVLAQVQVSAHFHLPWFGTSRNAFGPVFSLFLLGLFVLFVDGRSKIGWGFTVAGLVLIFWGIIQSLDVYFRSTSMLNAMIMFGLLFAGLGLIVRSLQPHDQAPGGCNPKGDA